MTYRPRNETQEQRLARVEANRVGRLAKFGRGLAGKRLVLEEIDESDVAKVGRQRANAGFAREVAEHGGAAEITEEQLKRFVDEDERKNPLRESNESWD